MDKKDYIEAKDWVKKAKKLLQEYNCYDDFKNHCTKLFGKKFFSIIDFPGLNVIFVRPEMFVQGGKPENHLKYPPTYKIIENNKLKRFNQEIIIDELAPILAEHVDRVELLKDVLHEQTPKELKDLYERVIGTKEKKKEPSIKQKPGCVYISIGGKPGNPKHLFIR